MKRTATILVMALLLAAGTQAAERLVKLDTISSDYAVRNNDVLTGTLQNKVYIYVPNNVTFTLRDATIEGENKERYAWAGITITGNVTMKVEGFNYIKGFYQPFPGIHVGNDATLRIIGTGKLYAYSNGDASGIGGGHGYKKYTDFNHDHWIEYNLDCGNISIEGGEIYAIGGGESPGIGTDPYEWCGYIHITTGVTKVVATKGDKCSYCIGGTGVKVGLGYDVVIGGKTYPANETGPCVPPNNGNSFIYIPWTGKLSELTDDSEVKDGSTITGTLTQLHEIYIPDGAHIKLKNATINSAGTMADGAHSAITCLGNATIEVTGEATNSVTGIGKGYPAIYVPEGKTLHIIGDGALMAYGAEWGAAIGGGSAVACGNIHIGGSVNLYAKAGCDYAAAIGGGYKKGHGTITIDNTVRRVKAVACESSSVCTIGAGWGAPSDERGNVIVGGKTYYGCIDDNPYTYYGPQQAIEDVNLNTPAHAVKTLRDGQLIIICNGVEYNAHGQMIK